MFSQHNGASDKLGEQISDQQMGDLNSGYGIGNLHLVQETMQENNFSPTSDKRMPKLNVDQIDNRLLDTIVVPTKFHIKQPSNDLSLQIQGDLSKIQKKITLPIGAVSTYKLGKNSSIEPTPANANKLEAQRRQENSTTLVQSTNPVLVGSNPTTNHQINSDSMRQTRFKANMQKEQRQHAGSQNERSMAQLP